MSPARLPPRLVPGERVRLSPGGPVWQVLRVDTGSAVLTRRKVRPPFTALDRKTGETKIVPGIPSSEVTTISPYAFVYRVGTEEKDDAVTEENPPGAQDGAGEGEGEGSDRA